MHINPRSSGVYVSSGQLINEEILVGGCSDLDSELKALRV